MNHPLATGDLGSNGERCGKNRPRLDKALAIDRRDSRGGRFDGKRLEVPFARPVRERVREGPAPALFLLGAHCSNWIPPNRREWFPFRPVLTPSSYPAGSCSNFYVFKCAPTEGLRFGVRENHPQGC